jgi:broad specificity phosphatase PhoE
VAGFLAWLRDHPAERIAVVGHGTFFHAVLGRWLANGEAATWSVD